MDSDVKLYEGYLYQTLPEEEMAEFEKRLGSDPDFALGFETYLRLVKGLRAEAREKDMEFGHAMKSLSREQLEDVIGRKRRKRRPWQRSTFYWCMGSVAALFIIVFLGIIAINFEPPSHLDTAVLQYNSYSSTSKGGEELNLDSVPPRERIPLLEEEYTAFRSKGPEYEQEAQEAGFRLAMTWLELHDRKNTSRVLRQLIEDYPDDQQFVARCQLILSQLNQ